MFIKSPEAFADLFNMKVPGTYRKITPDDVRLMTECKLVGRYQFYGRQDLEIVRALLKYEKLKANQTVSLIKGSNLLACKICGEPLSPIPEGTPGRPREYCSKCEPQRNTERQEKWRHRRKKLHL